MYNNLPEFIGEIIDVFEDFLEEKGIMLDNEDRNEAIREGEDPETLAIIYGEDYDIIRDQIETLLSNWDLIDSIEKR